MAQSYVEFIAACDLPTERVGRASSSSKTMQSLNRNLSSDDDWEFDGSAANTRRAAWDLQTGEDWQNAAYND